MQEYLSFNVSVEHVEAANASDTAFIVIRTTIYAFLTTLLVLGNAFVLFIVSRRQCDSACSSATKLFLVSLTIADLNSGVFIAFPMFITSAANRWILGSFMCSVTAFTRVFFNIGSLMSALAITLDRFVAVTRPLRYIIIMTRRQACVWLSVIWVVALFSAFMYGPILGRPAAYFHDYTACFFTEKDPDVVDKSVAVCISIFVILPLIATTIIYARLACIARKHVKNIAKIQAAAKEKASNTKYLETFMLISVGFALTWIPYATVQLIEMAYSEIALPQYLYLFICSLLLANNGINLFIYYGRNEKFKQTARKVVCNSLKSRSRIASSTT